MRKPFGYALCFFVVSSCSSLPVAAQFLPAGPQPLPTVIEQMSSGVKLRDVPASDEKSALGPLYYSTTLADAQRALKNFNDMQQRSKIAVEPLPTVPSPGTAHILVWQASPDLDPKIIRQIPKDFASNMPIFRAVAPAPLDIHGMFTPPRLPSSLGKPEKLPLY